MRNVSIKRRIISLPFNKSNVRRDVINGHSGFQKTGGVVCFFSSTTEGAAQVNTSMRSWSFFYSPARRT
jgi:hypothetical protein